MDRDTDNMHGFSIAFHRLDALGDNGFGLDIATRRFHPNPSALGDAAFFRQLFRNLDKSLGGCMDAFTLLCFVQ